jgi:hypothetical protein
MKLSTKGKYGVRAVYEIARHGKGPITIKEIAERSAILSVLLRGPLLCRTVWNPANLMTVCRQTIVLPAWSGPR